MILHRNTLANQTRFERPAFYWLQQTRAGALNLVKAKHADVTSARYLFVGSLKQAAAMLRVRRADGSRTISRVVIVDAI